MAAQRRRRRARRDRPRRWLTAVALIILGLWVAGLVAYARGLGCTIDEPTRRTDGIVVLTGSSDRLFVGIELLRRGLSRRLLISGVKPGLDKQTLSTAMGQAAETFECCVDLGEAARDTAGNAVETAAWAAQHGYKSLRVVTTAFHMPRGLLELRRRLPDTPLIAHPVCSEPIRVARWWSRPRTVLAVVGEFNKFLVSLVRGGAETWFGVTS